MICFPPVNFPESAKHTNLIESEKKSEALRSIQSDFHPVAVMNINSGQNPGQSECIRACYIFSAS